MSPTFLVVYNDNELQSVRDNATTSVFGSAMEFKDNANQTVEYAYDKNGNMTKDLNKKITDIQYNMLNLPNRITFEDGNSIEYVYDANGIKLRTIHNINGVTQTTNYCGNAIYENGELKTLLNEAGYYSSQDNKFHFYLKDHQGNVRVVADENGNVEEANDYYPFGGLFTSATDVQPYKYNGKELDRKGGLDWYDYGARQYNATIGRWHAVDPMSEKYYSISPYVYCANNPVKYVDPDGRDWRIQTSFNQETGKIEYNMTVNAVLYNNSSNSSFDMTKLAKSITQQIEDAYNISENDFVSTMKFNMRVANSVDDIKETDHVFQIVDQNELGRYTDKSDQEALAVADRFGLNIEIGTKLAEGLIDGTNQRSAAHELGHSGGLGEFNDTKGNLMMQAYYVQRLGGDENKSIQLNHNQIRTIRDNYINKDLNRFSPISRNWLGNKKLSK